MKRKRHTPEQIVRKLREGDRLLNEGKDLTGVLRALEVSESSWNRWRVQYGGMKANEARRLNIPTVAMVDTNADPEIIDYPIAGNDDAIRAIRVILQKLVDAIVSASGDSPAAAQAEMAGVSA